MLSSDLDGCEAAFSSRGLVVRVVEETGSTNDDARAWASNGAPHGAVVIADAQRSGRGRHGRSWSAPRGESLALSIVLRPDLSPASLPPIALVAGLAARTAIARRIAAARLKWPNDVVVGMRKIAGVLVEGAIAGSRVEHVVVGVGINVARTEFPPELAHATSLAREGASDLDRGALALDLCDALHQELALFLRAPTEIGARLAPHDALLGRRVVLEDGRRGAAAGIAHDGRLRVRLDDDSVVHAASGEVRLDAA